MSLESVSKSCQAMYRDHTLRGVNRTSLILERLGALLQQSVREDASRHGLLPIHIQVLHYLKQANRYSDIPIAIAEYFGITRGTVSQTLAVLERKGLLIKEQDAHHGKRLHLRLTAAGESALSGSWAERVEQAVNQNPDGGAAMEGSLLNLLSALQQVNGQRAFGICHRCAHFLSEDLGARCGLTRELLATDQIGRICREWTSPA